MTVAVTDVEMVEAVYYMSVHSKTQMMTYEAVDKGKKLLQREISLKKVH